MKLIFVFFYPYVLALYGASYNINQVLEGIVKKRPPDLSSLPQNLGPLVSVFEPAFNTYSILAALALYSAIFLLPALLIAGYVINRWKGCALTLAVIALPGILTLLGFVPQVNFLPQEFVLDAAGVLGIAWGMTPVVLLGLLTGWSVVLIASDALQLGDKFRHLYDHAWYGAAVIAGIFFVADLDAAHTARELQKENELSRQASSYLLRQVRDYDLQCQLAKSSVSSCVWASQVQQTLSEYASQDERLFHSTGPSTSTDIYDPFRYGGPQTKTAGIRKELMEFNARRCPRISLGSGSFKSVISGVCQRPPSAFVKVYPEPLDGKVDRDYLVRVVAIANEMIVPSLVASRERQARLKQQVDENNQHLNFKWIFYILFSIAAGGKIANSTARILDIGKQPPNEQRRCLDALQLVGAGLQKVGGWIVAPIRWCWHKLSV